jgi:hypothetical protein
MPPSTRLEARQGSPATNIALVLNQELFHVEDWQEWQIRADQVAADLGKQVDVLEREFFSEEETNFRAFWPRFRDLKERVRLAPAIKLEDKIALERRLRDLGSRAYKGQEVAYGESGERKSELLGSIRELRSSAEETEEPRELRKLRRQLDSIRGQFETGTSLMPPDRQAVWEAWREASQFVWQKLTSFWEANEEYLSGILAEARKNVESRNGNGARQSIGRFFDALKTRECRQSRLNTLKNEANDLRTAASQVEERARAQKEAIQEATPSTLDNWKAELERNRPGAMRLAEEVAGLERQLAETRSILEQAMLKGTLVDKRTKLSELERANRALEQRIEQSEEVSVLSSR